MLALHSMQMHVESHCASSTKASLACSADWSQRSFCMAVKRYGLTALDPCCGICMHGENAYVERSAILNFTPIFSAHVSQPMILIPLTLHGSRALLFTFVDSKSYTYIETFQTQLKGRVLDRARYS